MIPSVESSGLPGIFKETTLNDSMRKSRYLKIASNPKFTVKLNFSQRFRTTSSSEEDIFFPATQSLTVERASSKKCQPDANQKKV